MYRNAGAMIAVEFVHDGDGITVTQSLLKNYRQALSENGLGYCSGSIRGNVIRFPYPR